MANRTRELFWLPSIFGVVGVLVTIGMQASPIAISKATASICYAMSLVLLAIGFVLARKSKTDTEVRRGGAGGSAVATGEDSEATGGAGGNRGRGDGGAGGNATATGKRAKATGGAAGNG